MIGRKLLQAALVVAIVLTTIGCGPKGRTHSVPDCYAAVQFENNWMWSVAIYIEPDHRMVVWDLNIGDDETVCFTENEVMGWTNGLWLNVRVKGWANEWRRIEPFYDICNGGLWKFTIESHRNFAYSWGVGRL